jgi:peptide-methionine (S)-S-oxide reductase
VIRTLPVVALWLALVPVSFAGQATAVFAGGCFWCMEAAFTHRDGVIDVVSGYTGGERANPSYQNHQGFVEAVQVSYDPAQVSYPQLLDIFWRNIDPLDNGGQFCDRGPSYRSAIFAQTDAQRTLAQQSLAEMARRFAPDKVYTEIRPASKFWPAEDYHQDYYLKNPVRYKYYRWNCGRDQRLQHVWGNEAGGHQAATPSADH